MHILLNGEDVSDEIRTTQVTRASSRFSQFSGVRRLLTDIQRKTVGLVARESGGAVVEGRDMGTVVFPDADIKFYMKADSAERARRRHKELIEAGVSVSLEQVEADIVERDTRDASRAVAPLRPASDAHIIDTTALTPQAQLDEMLTLVQAAGGRR
jgi:cytidylate kinase